MRITVSKNSSPKTVGIWFIVFSIIFILVGIGAALIPKIKSRKCTEPVMAQVVELIPIQNTSTNSKGHRQSSVTYRPVFIYNYNGKDYREESMTSSYPPAFKVGEEVMLKIDPNDPTDFYAPSDKTIVFVGTIFAGMGGFFLFIGILVAIAAKKETKPSDEYI